MYLFLENLIKTLNQKYPDWVTYLLYLFLLCFVMAVVWMPFTTLSICLLVYFYCKYRPDDFYSMICSSLNIKKMNLECANIPKE